MIKLKSGRIIAPVVASISKDGFHDFRLKAKSKTCFKEDVEAINFYSLITYNVPDLLIFHVPNERKASVQAQMRLNNAGVKSGVSDYIILQPAGGYNFAVIELKRNDWSKSRLSTEQKAFLLSAQKKGGFAAVAYGCDAAITAVYTYLGLI